MALTLILSAGFDPELLDTRNLILQSAGYTVVPANSMLETVNSFRDGDFDLVLLCRSIPVQEKERLTNWIRATGSRVPVVSVMGKFSQAGAEGGLTVGSDPAEFLKGIGEILDKAAALAFLPRSREIHERPPAPEKTFAAHINDTEQQSKSSMKHIVPLARTG